MKTAAFYIDHLQLKPHPEGGYPRAEQTRLFLEKHFSNPVKEIFESL